MKETKEAIPEEIAVKLFQQIREENADKLISWVKLQCWGCLRFSDFENRGELYLWRSGDLTWMQSGQ